MRTPPEEVQMRAQTERMKLDGVIGSGTFVAEREREMANKNADGSVTENTEATPSPISQSTMEFAPAPANVIKIAADIDRTIAANLARVVGESGTVTNSRTYASTDDAQYKLDLAFMRKHLAATLNKETQRVKVTTFAQTDSPDTVSFYLSVATRKPRNGEAENAPAEEVGEPGGEAHTDVAN